MGKLKPFLTCCSCKEKIPREEIIFYGSQENQMKYCPTCYQEKRKREIFYDFVCELFGIRSPGPKIYSQRKRLKDSYGYSDEVIMKTLEYLYKIKKLNKGFETLGLVNPKNVDEALCYFADIEKEKEKMANFEPKKIKKIIVPVKPSERKVELINLDDYLED